MQHGGKKDSDMRHGYFLNLTETCNIAISLNRHATSGTPVKGPNHLVTIQINAYTRVHRRFGSSVYVKTMQNNVPGKVP